MTNTFRFSSASALGTVLVLCALFIGSAAQAATLLTDKADYAPGETAQITGSEFEAEQDVTLTIVGTNEDGTEAVSDQWDVLADDIGAFLTSYTLPNFYVPLYLLAANSETGEVIAETTFTDANLNVTVAGAGTGNGSISATNISCTSTAGASSGDCSQTYGGNPAITVLTATQASGSTFTGWNVTGGGSCAGTGTCALSSANGINQTATATFVLNAVVKTDPTLSISNSPVTYDGSAQAATVVGSVAGSVTDVKYDGSATVPTDAGTYAVTADFAPTDTTNYNSLSDASAGSFVINQASSITTVTFEAGPYVYKGSAYTATANVVGAGGLNEAVAVVEYSGDCTNVTVANGCTASSTYAGDANHTLSSDVQNITIAKADANCAISGYSADYDGAAHGATGDCTGVGGVSDVLSGLDLGDTFTNVPGGTAHWVFTDVTGNYNDDEDDVAIVINKASLDVIADDKSKLEGAADPAFTFHYSGFVNGEATTTAGIVSAPTCDVAGIHSAPGNYEILCTGGDAGINYEFNPIGGTLHVFSLDSVFKGLFAPLNLSVKDFQKNSTIPVKFALIGEEVGNFYGGEATLFIKDETIASAWTAVTASGGSNTGNIFRYDANAGQYIFNLSTKNSIFVKGHTYSFRIVLNGVEQFADQQAAIKIQK